MAARQAAGPALLLIGLLAVAGCGRRQPLEKPAPRPPVEVRAAVDRAVATTGDRITFRVTVDRDEAYEVEVPEPGAEIAGFRIVDAGRGTPRRRSGRVVEERWYELRADLVGSYVLPPLVVRYRPAGEPGQGRPEAAEAEGAGPEELESAEAGGSESVGQRAGGEVATSAIFVEVESVLPADGAAADIRGLKPLRGPRRAVPWSWLAAGVALLALAVAAAYWLRRRHRRPAAPPAPPHEVAFAALAALRGLDLSDPATLRRFYFGLSEVLRTYLEGRFGLNATDLTTEEIVARLPELRGLPDGPLPAERERELRRFLEDTDRVKFAHHRPSESEIEAAWERALGLVEATRPPAAPEPDAEREREAA